VCKQITIVSLVIPFTFFTYLSLPSTYPSESVPLLIDKNQDQDTEIPCTKTNLVTLLPAEIWHSIMEYLEGNNSFLNTVLARIFIPSARVREAITTSFNRYLAQASPEQRIKALRLFYATVRYAPEHNILGKTAHTTQALMQTLIQNNFNDARTQARALSHLTVEHALYLIEYCKEFTKNYTVQDQQQAPSLGCHCFYSTVGLALIFSAMLAFAQIKQPDNYPRIPIILFSIAACYWFCYGFMLCHRAYHLRDLEDFEKFLDHLEKDIQSDLLTKSLLIVYRQEPVA
jgi:hypothetical protein